jgi:hypothetical protein
VLLHPKYCVHTIIALLVETFLMIWNFKLVKEYTSTKVSCWGYYIAIGGNALNDGNFKLGKKYTSTKVLCQGHYIAIDENALNDGNFKLHH